MKTIGEALAETIALFAPLGGEEVALDLALGRVLAAPLVATLDLPAHDASIVDGYAVRAREVSEGARLPVHGESRAGGPLPPALAAGSTMRIFTGAPIPAGADAVVMQEAVSREGEHATFAQGIRAGASIRRHASDVARGTTLLEAGARIDAGAIALAASQGIAAVSVASRPRVAIVTTGDELRSPGETLGEAGLYDSNAPMLAALVHEAGAEPLVLPRARDVLDETIARLERAIAEADVVLTVGGVSVGDHDYVHAALAALGVERRLWKVRMKPGKPIAVGVKEGVPCIGLPGNPASAWVGFELFVRPGLRRMLGDPRPYRRVIDVQLGAAITPSADRVELARARHDHVGRAIPALSQASSALASTHDVDLLLVLPEQREPMPAGATVRALVLEGRGSATPPF
jgi:molybdopterin molybdotransferase